MRNSPLTHMMKIFFSIWMLLNISNLFGQKLEMFGGANNNMFHNYHNNEGHFMSSYNSDFGFTAGFGLDSIRIDWLTFRFTLQFDKYAGKLEASDGGLGSGFTTIAKVDKSVISLGIFPINFRILKRIDLNFGLIISRLIDESFNGTSSGWIMNQPNWSYNLQDKYNQYSSATYFGFQGRIAYDFKLSKLIWISPQYIYYFGLSNEFVEFPEDTKSMRHYFCIGIKKKFK
jgi:hypothetical protein